MEDTRETLIGLSVQTVDERQEMVKRIKWYW